MQYGKPNWMLGLLASAVLAAIGLGPSRVAAIPVFAHRYAFSCQQCHSTVPQLNAFGERFRAAGFRLPGAPTHATLPVAVKVNLAYSSEPDPTGLPKALVDEIELLTGGSRGKLSYFVESYVVDGGRHGSVRDAWARYATADQTEDHRTASALRVGQFTLPLPVDPESFRLTERHYAIFDQTVGASPFNLFDPRLGAEFDLNLNHVADISLLALRGHDPQSGLASRGIDTMISMAAPLGPIRLSAYRYAGSRPLAFGIDSFWRLGYGASANAGKLDVVGVLQTGNDGNATASGAASSSGGFLEARWTFSPALTAVARYDGTNDPSGLHRSTTVSVIRRLTRNSKLTLEDVLSTSKQSFNAGLLFAY
jgi:hypothetical protein